MPIRTGLILAVVLLTSCSSGGVSHVTVTARAAEGSLTSLCTADKPCALTGTLTLERRSGNHSWATLSQGDACAPLLLPASTYNNSPRWKDKQVRVSGTALARGPALPEVILLQYRDRWLSPSVCSASDLVLYVDEIVAANKP